MGSPLSPILADIYMETLESAIVVNNPKIDLWVRYVDDVFCQLRPNGETVLDELNAFHPQIQFTEEVEKPEGIPFLDSFIYRKGEIMGHKVYRKPTHTDIYLNYGSSHPFNHKISVVRTLFRRALKILDAENLQNEINHVKKVLKENNYPEHVIQKVYERIIKNEDNNRATEDNPQVICLPYQPGLSEKITRLIKPLKCKVAYKPLGKLKDILSTVKDKPEPLMLSGIYEINCSCGTKYVGETERPLYKRIKEHQASCKKGSQESAISDHVWNTKNNSDHVIQWNDAKIILQEKRKTFRKAKEALLIQRTFSPLMNRKEERPQTQLSPIWSSVKLL